MPTELETERTSEQKLRSNANFCYSKFSSNLGKLRQVKFQISAIRENAPCSNGIRYLYQPEFEMHKI